jgi:hypothetical protein
MSDVKSIPQLLYLQETALSAEEKLAPPEVCRVSLQSASDAENWTFVPLSIESKSPSPVVIPLRMITDVHVSNSAGLFKQASVGGLHWPQNRCFSVLTKEKPAKRYCFVADTWEDRKTVLERLAETFQQLGIGICSTVDKHPAPQVSAVAVDTSVYISANTPPAGSGLAMQEQRSRLTLP